MLATEILTQEHRQALSLIEKLEGVRNDERGHRENFAELDAALMLHMREEEEIYYPALAELDAALMLHMREEEEIYYPALAEHEEFRDIMEENVPEHEMVKENLARMRELSVASDVFQSLLAETRAALEAHMTTEEDNIFPRSITVLGEKHINALGTEIDALKGDAGISRTARM